MLRRTSKSRRRRIEEYKRILERYDSLPKETFEGQYSGVHGFIDGYISLLRTEYRWLRIPIIGELANAIIDETPDSLHHAETYLRVLEKSNSN